MTVRRWAPWVALVVVVVVALVIGSRSSAGSSPAARASAIAAEVRCPQCEGQSALASEAPAARAVRAFIAEEVAAGRTKGQIERELEDRYGTDILLRPPASGVGGLVWAIPVAVFAVAAAGLVMAFRRWRPRAGGPPSDADRERVRHALDDTP